MVFPLLAQFDALFARRRAYSTATLLLFFVAGAHGVRAAPQPLTLGDAQQQAIARSRQLTAQDLASSVAHEMAIAAAQRPDPVLKAGIDNLPVTGPDRLSLGRDFMTMRRVGIAQELTGSDKLHWRAERLEREAGKARAQKDVELAAIQRDTAIAWLESRYTEQMVELVARQAALARQEIEAIDAAYRAGRASQADVLAARSALLMLDDRRSEIGRRCRVARTMLTRWTGVSAGVALAQPPGMDTIRLDPATLDTDLAHHPQIAVMNKQAEVAQADANLAQANRRADWSVEVAFQQRGPAFSNMVSLGLSIPLQWDRKNRQDREWAARLAMVEQTKAERDDMLREHVAQTHSLIVQWQSGRERIARYAQQLLPLAAERNQALLAAYRGGKATLMEVLAARRQETEVQMQALELELDTARLWAQLNFLFPDGPTGHATMNTHQESK